MLINDTLSQLYSSRQQEQDRMITFKELTTQSHEITSEITNLLTTFDTRLAKLEETILPLYNETESLQLKHRNIEATVLALNNVIDYYSISSQVENVVRANPSTLTGLDPFIDALDRLKQAQLYFERNSPQSVELENVSSLFNMGSDALNREFKEILLKYSKPMQPIALLDLVATDEEISADDSSVSSHGHFPEGAASDMTRIAQWLVMESRDEFMNVYARIRATIMMKSLNALKDHQKSGSAGSTQGISASPVIRPKSQNRSELLMSGRRTSKRLQSVIEKSAKNVFFTLGGRRPTLHLSGAGGGDREDVIDEQEMDSYLMSVMAVQRLMQIELSLLSTIIPSQHQHRVFQIIIQEALDNVVQDGENIASRAKKCIARRDFPTVLAIYPILKSLFALKPEFERTIESCDYNVRTQFSNVVNALQNIGTKVLDDFVDYVRMDSSVQLPKDGTVCQLTSDVMIFLEQLLDYCPIIGSAVLAQDVTYSGAVAALLKINKSLDKNKVMLGIFTKKVLSQLNHALTSKSESYADVGVKSLFRMNNCNYILKSLQRCALMEIMRLSDPNCQQTYATMIANHKKAYLQCWNKLSSYIANVDDIQVYYGKLKDKDRNLLKERFAGFNKEMEEISRLQRSYSIPDFELRESLKRDNKEFILPKYNLFYDRYANQQFAKNHEKYVKYTPEQVAAIMDRFFDVAA